MTTLAVLYLLINVLAVAGSLAWLAALYHDWDLAQPERPNDFTPKTLLDVLIGSEDR